MQHEVAFCGAAVEFHVNSLLKAKAGRRQADDKWTNAMDTNITMQLNIKIFHISDSKKNILNATVLYEITLCEQTEQ